jgi:endonuclease-8
VPEGDTLRRLADRIGARFTDQEVTRSVFRHPRLVLSDLAGRRLTGVDATGKHLLLRFDDSLTLHVHLLMQGRVRIGPQPEIPEWRRRFEIGFENGILTGVDIPLLHLFDTAKEHQFVGHLGPDLCGTYDHEAAVARLEAAADRPLSAALLDQRVVAGFGNVYAIETPFICGLNPFTLVGNIEPIEPVASVGAALIRTNAALGPQNTTGRRLHTSENWVMSSQTRACKICGTKLNRLSGSETPWQRQTVWCPMCQPVAAATPDLVRVARLLALHPARRMLDLETGRLTADTAEPVAVRPKPAGGRRR